MSDGQRTIAETDERNGTHTQYLVTYGTGALLCDVHEMIERVASDDDVPAGDPHEIVSIVLVLPDQQGPVLVEVTTCDGNGIEWEIARPGAPTIYEYVCYADETHETCNHHDVYVIAFPNEPTVP